MSLHGSHRLALLAAGVSLWGAPLAAQAPAGLARRALHRADFPWVTRSAPGVRVHFLAGSYPARHQDSLVARVVDGRAADLALLDRRAFDRTLDVFFIESRAQMDSLVGAPVTGFAQMDSAAVFLVTNPDWRSFERHEIMHVLAVATLGRPASPGDWIQEGFAQFADGRCGAYGVDAVVSGLLRSEKGVPLDTLFARFRELDDLTAYLEAASLVGYVHRTYGLGAVERIWRRGATALPSVLGVSVDSLEAAWRRSLPPPGRSPPEEALESIRKKGCG